MFGKLLKAEWRASRRVVGILCLAVFIAALVLGAVGCCLLLAERYNWSLHDSTDLVIVSISAATMMVIGISWAAGVFYALWRFYRSRFTEEGYLTCTLPVGGHQLMLSAILASVLEILVVLLATAASMVVGMGICALGIPWNEIPADFLPQLRQQMKEMWQQLAPYAGTIAGALLTVALAALGQLIQLMLSVTIGAMAAKKHPILMAILVYYGIGIVKTTISTAAMIGTGSLLNRFGVMTTVNVLSALTVVGGYLIMYFLTTKKLNLN